MKPVSNFELLIGRIAPGPVSPLNRRIVQGYFLTITNLEDHPVQLVISMTSTAGGGQRQLDVGMPNTLSNTNVVFDNGVGNDTAIPCVVALNTVDIIVYRTQTDNPAPANNLLPIKPKQTMLFTLLPNVRAYNFGDSTSNSLEIRGFVEVRQEYDANGNPPAAPAKMIVTAEHRGTFLDNNFPNAGDYDQISYTVPFGSGAAVQEIN
jgi:hypothetical protein